MTGTLTTVDYEVWEQTGGFTPSRCLWGLTKGQAQAQVREWSQHGGKYARAEAMQHRYYVVKATITREEVSE